MCTPVPPEGEVSWRDASSGWCELERAVAVSAPGVHSHEEAHPSAESRASSWGTGGCSRLAFAPRNRPRYFHTPGLGLWEARRIPNAGNKPVRAKTRPEFLLLAQDNGPSEEPEAPSWLSMTRPAGEGRKYPQPLLLAAREAADSAGACGFAERNLRVVMEAGSFFLKAHKPFLTKKLDTGKRH